MEEVYQGQSLEILVSIEDDAGNPINIATDANAVCQMILFDSKDNQIERFKYPSAAGYKTIALESPTTGEYLIRVDSSKTANGSEGPAYLEIKCALTNDDFEESKFIGVTRVPDLFHLIRNQIKKA